MRAKSARSISAVMLLAPLFLFILLFFIWPLIGMGWQAVSDTAVVKALPRTTAAVASWDRTTPPTADMRKALIEDLRAANDDQAVGDMVRRLNSAKSGFRTLMAKTITAARSDNGDLDLFQIDQRWNDNGFWVAIAGSLSPITDRNLLGAVDLMRDASGNVTTMPAGTSANLETIVRTFTVAGTVMLAAAIVGYPFAMITANSTGLVRAILLGSVLLPLWTSLLVRTAAWFIILQENGLINELLQYLHLTSGPIPLIFNRVGVVIAMTHVLLPFMVLPIHGALVGIPRELVPAAASLGAGPFQSFYRVILPLSIRGLSSGCLLVFMSAIGYYITPALIGGPGDQMVSSVIAFYATGTANWGMAGALGIILLAATLILYGVYGKLSAEDPGRG